MKLLTLSKKTVSHFLPIFDIDGKKLGPVPPDFPCMVDNLIRCGCSIPDEKLRDQLKNLLYITVNETNPELCKGTAELEKVSKDLIALFNEKYRCESATAAKQKPLKKK